MTNTKQTKQKDIEVGIRISNLRKSRGMTRQVLAKEIGVTHQQITKYETGVNRITIGRLDDIAATLEFSVYALLEIEPDIESINAARESIAFLEVLNTLSYPSQLLLRRLAKHMSILEG